MTDEHFILDGDSFANECMARDLDPFSDPGAFLDLDKRTDLALVAYLTAVQIDKRHGLRVIEDACQAHGAAYKGRKAGTIGDAGAFSFYYSKNLGAYGEGGFITTNNEELAQRIRKTRDHGSGARYHHDLLGFNARLDEIQAVVLRAKLPYLAAWNEKRRHNAQRYNELLKVTPVTTPIELPGNYPIYHLYVIKTPKRDELQAWLKERGIFTGIHYPIPIHLQKSMAFLGYQPGGFPETEKVVGEILSLPMFAELTDEQIDAVGNAIRSFFK